jgi:NAD(P)H-flavin reductase
MQHVGFVTPDLLVAHMFPPADDLLIVICGPYPMCQALKSKVLPAAGYTPEMFFCYM